jgi:hypothetical protein
MREAMIFRCGRATARYIKASRAVWWQVEAEIA